MTQSPTATAIADALDELDLYADTDEAQAARVLVRELDLDIQTGVSIAGARRGPEIKMLQDHAEPVFD
ncbi:MAG: hypothetical protein ACRD1G_14160 [Acidimicrobiales bacterium]